nr:GbsR/MarR family transcriptional regulator [Caldalkalibacillus salinus]
MDHYGVTASMGMLYGLLYFHNEPITLDEMGAKMGMSKGSMSTGVRKLLENKMVHRVYKPGTRKDLYIAETDFYKNFINFFIKKWEDEINVNVKAIDQAEKEYRTLLESEALSPEVIREIEIDQKKFQEARDYYHFLEKLVGCFESGRIFDLIEKDAERHE